MSDDPVAALAPSVLLVDDNPRLVPLVTRLLGMLGFQSVRVAADAAGARLALKSMPIGLVVCDLDLPGPEDGLGLLRWVRSTDALRDVPFIVTEETLAFEEVIAAHDLGADGILLKPFEADLFRRKIRAAVSSNARRRRRPERERRVIETNATFMQSLYGLHDFQFNRGAGA